MASHAPPAAVLRTRFRKSGGSGRKEGSQRLIHGVYVNMSPRTAAMVVGKVSSGLLYPVRGIHRHVNQPRLPRSGALCLAL